jgi:hypothetical protein
MTRPAHEVHEEIVDMTPEERGHLIRRVMSRKSWTEEQKNGAVEFIMLLGLIGQRMPKNGKRRLAN